MSEIEVVRADQVPPGTLAAAYTGVAVLPGDVRRASRIIAERDALLEAARRDAAAIVAAASQEAEALRESTRNAMVAEARSRVEILLAAMQRELDESREERVAVLREAAVELACRVVRMSHDRHPEALEALVTDVAEEVERFTPVAVRIGAADAAFVGLESEAVLAGLKVVVDETLPRGTVLIETMHGNIRSSFEERADALRRRLRP